MKKILIFTVVFFILLLSVSFSKTMISDEELEDVTAEDGVNVNLNNLTVRATQTVGVTSWGDGDGYGGTYTSAGYMGAQNMVMSGTFASFSNNDMQIDIGTSGSSTRMNIVLPTITMGAMNVDTIMKVSTSMDLSGTKELGRLKMTGLTTRVTMERLQIYAH